MEPYIQETIIGQSIMSKSVISKNGNPILREGLGGGDAGMQFNRLTKCTILYYQNNIQLVCTNTVKCVHSGDTVNPLQNIRN